MRAINRCSEKVNVATYPNIQEADPTLTKGVFLRKVATKVIDTHSIRCIYMFRRLRFSRCFCCAERLGCGAKGMKAAQRPVGAHYSGSHYLSSFFLDKYVHIHWCAGADHYYDEYNS